MTALTEWVRIGVILACLGACSAASGNAPGHGGAVRASQAANEELVAALDRLVNYHTEAFRPSQLQGLDPEAQEAAIGQFLDTALSIGAFAEEPAQGADRFEVRRVFAAETACEPRVPGVASEPHEAFTVTTFPEGPLEDYLRKHFPHYELRYDPFGLSEADGVVCPLHQYIVLHPIHLLLGELGVFGFLDAVREKRRLWDEHGIGGLGRAGVYWLDLAKELEITGRNEGPSALRALPGARRLFRSDYLRGGYDFEGAELAAQVAHLEASLGSLRSRLAAMGTGIPTDQNKITLRALISDFKRTLTRARAGTGLTKLLADQHLEVWRTHEHSSPVFFSRQENGRSLFLNVVDIETDPFDGSKFQYSFRASQGRDATGLKVVGLRDVSLEALLLSTLDFVKELNAKYDELESEFKELSDALKASVAPQARG